uniref:Uncharacterized protein n=1 Tax=Anopheles maculatus TaxID=74869 RepID=A0A182T4Q9_9DIPT
MAEENGIQVKTTLEIQHLPENTNLIVTTVISVPHEVPQVFIKTMVKIKPSPGLRHRWRYVIGTVALALPLYTSSFCYVIVHHPATEKLKAWNKPSGYDSFGTPVLSSTALEANGHHLNNEEEMVANVATAANTEQAAPECDGSENHPERIQTSFEQSIRNGYMQICMHGVHKSEFAGTLRPASKPWNANEDG